jgi:hypothetical protein
MPSQECAFCLEARKKKKIVWTPSFVRVAHPVMSHFPVGGLASSFEQLRHR